MKDFKNKTVVITGAGSGIGRALSYELADRGANVAIADIDEANLQETAAEIKKRGVKMFAKVFDVAKYDQFQQFAEDVKQNLGPADLVINNAGVALGKLNAEETSIELFEWLMGINFWGMVYGSKVFLPQLHKNETTALVNVSSMFGLVGIMNQSAYCASKFGIRGFTEVLMAEYDQTNIQIHSVHPGGIKTNVARNARGGDPRHTKTFEKLLKIQPKDAAKIIVNGIVKNKKRILIGNEAYASDIVSRIYPIKIINYFQRKVFKAIGNKAK